MQDNSKIAAYKSNSAESAFIIEKVEECSAKLKLAQAEIAKEVWGQDNIIALTIACMVAGGHLLSVGAPGLAKTRLVSRVANVMGLGWNRVQFTPDLMPADILGSEVARKDPQTGETTFEFVKGPVFTQFLMADEINRAGPRTQAALLEAMQEKRVTIAGHTYTLQRPFTVMATQNPLEQEGTYPLPEAQLDRFLMRLDVDYPDEDAEKRVMVETTSSKADLADLFARNAAGEDLTVADDKDTESLIQPVLGKNDLILMQKLAAKLPLSEQVVDTALKIVRRARPDHDKNASGELQKLVNNYIEWGPGPRAVQAFAQAARARALMDGRNAPEIQDILAVAPAVLEHRMGLNPRARADNVAFKDVLAKLTHDI